MNLSAYNNQIVNVSWQQWATGTLSPTDALQFQFSGDGGATWSSTTYTAAQDDVQVDSSGNGGFQATQPSSTPNPATNPPGTQGYFSFQIPNQYLTTDNDNFRMRFYLSGFGSGKFCYIDNIYITNVPVVYYDAASYASPNTLSRWTSDGDWKGYYSNEFVGTHVSGSNRYLTMSSNLDLSTYTGQTFSVTWNQSESGSLLSSDGLQFQFSGDGGTTWSTTVYTAFTDDNPNVVFTQSIPSQYITDSFKLRFYLLGFGSSKYCYIDDIKIYSTGQAADTTAFLMIDGHQVSFNATTGLPQKDVVVDLQADRAYVDPNTLGGYSFACVRDVTALIRNFGTKGPNNNYPGNDTYKVGGVSADPAPLSHPGTQYQLAYAGWSLVIIYSSAETLGHQLYLYDTNFLHNDGNANLDFDQDGNPGGTITGFLVPAQIPDETIAAKITCFIGEGDDLYTGDYIALNGTKLWDGINTTGNSAASPNNVWNGKSLGMSADGVDVDTFQIPWLNGPLHQGDNSAQVDLVTATDQWNLIYIILAFRSKTTTGGAITYLIK
jgi:hypothetical protein